MVDSFFFSSVKKKKKKKEKKGIENFSPRYVD
jgi:hypothetical protein